VEGFEQGVRPIVEGFEQGERPIVEGFEQGVRPFEGLLDDSPVIRCWPLREQIRFLLSTAQMQSTSMLLAVEVLGNCRADLASLSYPEAVALAWSASYHGVVDLQLCQDVMGSPLVQRGHRDASAIELLPDGTQQ